MPRIYLSPSTQESNPYISGGSEEYYMNLLADDLEPYLISNAIAFQRNTPQMTAASSIRQANAGVFDLYLALHSNASPPQSAGQNRGPVVFYYPTSAFGKRAAEIFARNLRVIYPQPQLVKTMPTTSLGEVSKSRAPAVLIEIAYHDNAQDAAWIKNNLPLIASNIAYSLTQIFEIPFIEPIAIKYGTVNVDYGTLRIRERPNFNASTLAHAHDGDKLLILGQYDGWYSVDFDGVLGYAASSYII